MAVNAVYRFECPCGAIYIGESECLKSRIIDHQQRSKQTAVFCHTDICETFQTRFQDEYEQNNFKSRFDYLSKMFSVLHKNLAYHKRVQMEALEIRLNNPPLNKQIQHQQVFII